MNGWKTVRLDECCEIISGATPKTSSAEYWDGDIYWATPKDLSDLDGAYISDTPRKLTQAGLESCAATILPAGSVLFSSRAPIGHVAVNTVPMATNQGFKSFVPKTDQIHAKFLYHWLRTNRSYLESLGNGATFKEVSKSVISRVKISLPLLEEQQRIADILDRAEALRAKRQETLAQLDELTQSIFIEMFGDLIENPKRWDIKKIADIAEVKTGGTPSRSIEGYWQNGTVPWVKTTEIKENIIYETEEFISESGLQNSNAVLIPQNSILIAMYGQGTTRGRSAKLGIQSTTNQACAAILPSDKYETDFLWTFLRLSYDTLRNLGRGGNQPNLNLSMIKDFKVYFPPIEKQKEFSKILAHIEKIKQSQKQSLLELNNLFDSLSNEAFTGKLFSHQFFEQEIENGVKI